MPGLRGSRLLEIIDANPAFGPGWLMQMCKAMRRRRPNLGTAPVSERQ
jgi:hypothetical protein